MLTREEFVSYLKTQYETHGTGGGGNPANVFFVTTLAHISNAIKIHLLPKLEAELFESAFTLHSDNFLTKNAIRERLSGLYKEATSTMRVDECIKQFYDGVSISDIASSYFFANFEKFVMVDNLYESYKNSINTPCV